MIRLFNFKMAVPGNTYQNSLKPGNEIGKLPNPLKRQNL